jgi:hypothetical protein
MTGDTECEYCGTQITSDDEIKHYSNDHSVDELTIGDRKRVENYEEEETVLKTVRENKSVVALLVPLVFLLAVVVYISFGGLSSQNNATGAEIQPTGQNTVHIHGQIQMTVNGESVDFGQQKYQLQDDAFHFESDRPRWHVHADQVTLEYGLESLGFGPVTTETISYNGKTYDDTTAGETVKITVNGEEVTPQEYILKDGDSIRIIVKG